MYIAILLLGIIGAIAAIILFFISKKFEVQEDPRIIQISEILPGANCGGVVIRDVADLLPHV